MKRKALQALLTEHRKALGLRLVDVAAVVGCSASALSAGTISGETMREVAKLLHIDAEDVEAAWYEDACADLDRRWSLWWGES